MGITNASIANFVVSTDDVVLSGVNLTRDLAPKRDEKMWRYWTEHHQNLSRYVARRIAGKVDSAA